MREGKKVTAIILVAGNSTRYGQNRNKNFEDVNGKPVLFYSLNAFDNNTYIDNIVVAVKQDEMETVKEIIQKENFQKPIHMVVGGNSRKESVYNCLRETTADIVIIHDGARPAIKPSYIDKCIESILSLLTLSALNVAAGNALCIITVYCRVG